MPVIPAALTAVKIAIAVSQHPVTQAGIFLVMKHPATRQGAARLAGNAAYGAGIVAGKAVRAGSKVIGRRKSNLPAKTT